VFIVMAEEVKTKELSPAMPAVTMTGGAFTGNNSSRNADGVPTA